MTLQPPFDSWFDAYIPKLENELLTYLRIETFSGQESLAFSFLENLLEMYNFDYRYQSCDSKLYEHHAYTKNTGHRESDSIRAEWNPSKKVKTRIVFNSHIDVVPIPEEARAELEVRRIGDWIHGRGACDTKGNLFILLGALKYMQHAAISCNYAVTLDLVSSEETGGNGTLSLLSEPHDYALAVVFEPTQLMLHNGHRGCLTCEIEIVGKGVHMGSDSAGLSAIVVARHICQALEDLNSARLVKAREDVSFKIWKRPIQINVGKIRGGEWPGSVPERCTITCNIGFLPNETLEDIEHLIQHTANTAIAGYDEATLSFNFDAGLRNKAYLSPQNEHIQRLNLALQGVSETTRPLPMYAWCASCDARHYALEAEIPTVIFGAGNLADAHSSNEKISIPEIKYGILTIVKFLSENFKEDPNE